MLYLHLSGEEFKKAKQLNEGKENVQHKQNCTRE